MKSESAPESAPEIADKRSSRILPQAGETAEYLAAVFGTTTGRAHLAVGSGPFIDDNGRYRHRDWTPSSYAWPEESDRLARAIAQASTVGDDVYVCPYLMHSTQRAKGAAVERTKVHADLDGSGVSAERLGLLGTYAVESGTPGHAHVYVDLAGSVPAHWHTALCRAVGAFLGDADAKISDNDVLRPPGTLNHKAAARGGQSTPVRWLARPTGRRWDPQQLSQALGAGLPTAEPSVAAAAVEPVALDRLPARLRDAVAEVTGDRSTDTMRIVGACHDAGLTLAQTRGVIADRRDLAERLAERTDDDVLTCWLKATDSRAAVRQCELAAGPPEDNPADGLAFQRDVTAELQRLRVRKAAQDALRAENEPEAHPFDSGTLREVMARPADPPMRVERLVPSDASALLAAQRKTGKTTLSLNLSRCLLTGEDFLGAFGVRPLAGSVAFLNYEVGAAQLARWAHDCGVPDDRLLLVNLRGRRNPLAHPDDRARLAALLRSHEVEAVIVDPFGRAYAGASQNDAGEVGAWLVDLDRFVRTEAGATDLVLNAHAGWNGERTRGSSALEDWADVVVTLTRDADDENQRFLRAVGRDVDLDEDRLDYDPQTRMLRLTGTGSRRAARDNRKLSELAVLVVRAARESPGVNAAAMVKAIRGMDDAPGFRDRDVSAAARLAAEHGRLRIESEGPGRPTKHFALDTATPSNPVPTPSRDAPPTPSTPSIGDGVGVGGSGEPSPVDGVGLLNGTNGAAAEPAAHRVIRAVVEGKPVRVDLSTGKVLDEENGS